MIIPKRFDRVVCQFSSMGSQKEKWIRQDWLPSISAEAFGLGSSSRAPPKMEWIIPTEVEVRDSIQGWSSGDAIPIREKCHKDFMREWKEPSGRTDKIHHFQCTIHHF